MTDSLQTVDTVRASRAGHTYHERWTARRALQLVFPNDNLFAIAVEGPSSTETKDAGTEAEEVADLVLYYGGGDNFDSADAVQTVQFKYKVADTPQTASFLKKTIQKFGASVSGYEGQGINSSVVSGKLSFLFVTNADFSSQLWAAISALKEGTIPPDGRVLAQFQSLSLWCTERNIDPQRLFSMTTFQAGTKSLSGQNNALRRTIADWLPGNDSQSRTGLHGLTELVREKAGLSGQRSNLIKREDVLDALGYETYDLFPAETRFLDIGMVVERTALAEVHDLLTRTQRPVVITADGGVGKTVFVQSLASKLIQNFEVVIFDCFGGGAYRSVDQARHLPKVGLLQIVNELASRGLCDPLLPTDSDRVELLRAAKRRLSQAARTVRSQSNKSGIVVILDAADNAQQEADDRKEDAFPKLLLSALGSDPVEGVKLLLTARPHRAEAVVGKTDVERVSLQPFSAEEARSFLKERRTDMSTVELMTAIARSKGNARVLEYLVESWDINVAGNAPLTGISVEHLIAEKCSEIFKHLHVVGWSDRDVREFFAAISLLPPPIPLSELANALRWPLDQVQSAASDLAPMLEIVVDGAIFRDEPTETYIRKTYANELDAQRAIAQRLLDCQSVSTYAAEALPRFLVVTNDSAGAFALAASTEYPSAVVSEYGRRRLHLLRLRAAFTLAVADVDFDHILQISMRLAQVASANARGDEYIRKSPDLAIVLGDGDTSRRLFNDRSGWRGARNSRLTLAYTLQGETFDAEIQRERAIGWINWRFTKTTGADAIAPASPDATDFAAVLLTEISAGTFRTADRNLSDWNLTFSLMVCSELLAFVDRYEIATGASVLQGLVDFASSKACKSEALRIALLGMPMPLSTVHRGSIAAAGVKHGSKKARPLKIPYDEERTVAESVAHAAFGAIACYSANSADAILKTVRSNRPSSYDYGERHGPSRAWPSVLYCCLTAWSKGEVLSIRHLLPRQAEIEDSEAFSGSLSELETFLAGLEVRRPANAKRRSRKQLVRRFNRSECKDIAQGIELVMKLAGPIGDAISENSVRSSGCLTKFIDVWEECLRKGARWRFEDSGDVLCRTVGLGFTKLLLQYSDNVLLDDATRIVGILAEHRFLVSDKLTVLELIARRPVLHDIAGQFAKAVSDGIDKDEYIEQRGENYLRLAGALLPMSLEEAREYYRRGLVQLDQMGGGDHELVYSVLNYAAKQPGGFVKPELGHRLMNLAQAIFHFEPGKFGWTLFARAAAKSIGPTAIFKLLRWHDQGVANFSYGFPQLACFLAGDAKLDARRATVLLALCENQGWNDWQLGTGLIAILGQAAADDHQTIFAVILEKLELELPFGGWETLWNSMVKAMEKHPNELADARIGSMRVMEITAREDRDETNLHLNNGRSFKVGAEPRSDAADDAFEQALEKLIASCDLGSPDSIDDAVRQANELGQFRYGARKQLLEGLRAKCGYDQRLPFTMALCETKALDFDATTDQIVENVAMWRGSSTALPSQAKPIIEKIFEWKGTKLFDLKYHGITREIAKLVEFCGDAHFVMRKVLETVAKEQVELGGEEWMQICISLCSVASPPAARDALEDLLASPASRIADEIGEGPYQPSFGVSKTETGVLAETIWHLLGDDDGYIRWSTARTLEAVAKLGLREELLALLELFDAPEIDALASAERTVPLRNSQQWLLMGLARATLVHGSTLGYLKQKLQALFEREDLHVIFKLSIARSLLNIESDNDLRAARRSALSALKVPGRGFASPAGRTPETERIHSEFKLDYEFTKNEAPAVARLFGVSVPVILDAVVTKIISQWPLAKDMGYFKGRERYRHDGSDRHEFFREHIQRHALLSVATDLGNTLPVVRREYEGTDHNPWSEWLAQYDVSFDDGSWISDHKDQVPAQARSFFIKYAVAGEKALDEQSVLLSKIGLGASGSDRLVPVAGYWTSKDGVSVRITTALTSRRGAAGRCKKLSKREDHEFWLRLCSDDGGAEREPGDSFEAWIWEPQSHRIGIDGGDQFSSRSVIARPRAGKFHSASWELKSDADGREWTTPDGKSALTSQVWGSWEPNPEQSQYRQRNDGQLLWADTEWLDHALERSSQQLVYIVNFVKYKGQASFDKSPGLRASYVCLRGVDGNLDVRYAKKASASV